MQSGAEFSALFYGKTGVSREKLKVPFDAERLAGMWQPKMCETTEKRIKK